MELTRAPLPFQPQEIQAHKPPSSHTRCGMVLGRAGEACAALTWSPSTQQPFLIHLPSLLPTLLFPNLSGGYPGQPWPPSGLPICSEKGSQCTEMKERPLVWTLSILWSHQLLQRCWAAGTSRGHRMTASPLSFPRSSWHWCLWRGLLPPGPDVALLRPLLHGMRRGKWHCLLGDGQRCWNQGVCTWLHVVLDVSSS